MPRRFIKESIKTSKTLRKLSDGAHRTFMNLIVTQDDFGRFHGDLDVLRSNLYPFNDRQRAKFDKDIDELVEAELLTFYVQGDRTFCILNTFIEHQGPPRAEKSKFPDPEDFHSTKKISVANKGDSICAQMRADVPVFRVPCSESRVSNSDIFASALADFERVWKIYPNRKSRGQAERAWTKLSPSPELIAEMLASVGAQISWREGCKRIGQWTPEWKNFSTWLNGKCWLDEVKNETTNRHPGSAQGGNHPGNAGGSGGKSGGSPYAAKLRGAGKVLAVPGGETPEGKVLP